MVAIIGMTVFEAMELWLFNEAKQDLYVCAAVHDSDLHHYTAESKQIRLKPNQDMAGHSLVSSCPYWDHNYHKHKQSEEYPRAELAANLNIQTAFAIPIPGSIGSCGALVMYSRQELTADPLMVTLMERAMQLLSASAIDQRALALFDIETWTNNSYSTLQKKMVDRENEGRIIDEVNGSTVMNGLHVPSSLPRQQWNVKQMTLDHDDSANGRKRPLELSLLPAESTKSVSNHVTSKHIEKLQLCQEIPQSSTTPRSQKGTINHNLIAPMLYLFSQRCPPFYINPYDVSPIQRIHGFVFSRDVPNVRKGRRLSVLPMVQQQLHSLIYIIFFQLSRLRSYIEFSGCTEYFSLPQHKGGGRRCTVEGCFKAARDKFFCAGHGGGKRCTIEGCTKAAVGGSGFCTAHGGGKRCQEPGCNKSSQASTNFCVRHGGGRKCIQPNCSKAARSRTDYCASHGGGLKCKVLSLLQQALWLRFHRSQRFQLMCPQK